MVLNKLLWLSKSSLKLDYAAILSRGSLFNCLIRSTCLEPAQSVYFMILVEDAQPNKQTTIETWPFFSYRLAALDIASE